MKPMKKFWKNVLIFCTFLFIGALILSYIDGEIKFTVIAFCVILGGISAMILFYYRARKKGGRGERQQTLEQKNIGWRFR
jgi:uncharacterized membrane protein YfcA